jgi:hypothetical protein
MKKKIFEAEFVTDFEKQKSKSDKELKEYFYGKTNENK